jgi:hypothetical protein
MALGRPAQGSVKQPIVMDAKHMHFGGGQTETMLTLLTGHLRSSCHRRAASHISQVRHDTSTANGICPGMRARHGGERIATERNAQRRTTR